jgi:hypothetical protein
MTMRSFLPPPDDFDAVALARAAAAGLDLHLPDAEIDAIALNLSRTAGFAALLACVPEIDAEAPAPVFRADHLQ